MSRKKPKKQVKRVATKKAAKKVVRKKVAAKKKAAPKKSAKQTFSNFENYNAIRAEIVRQLKAKGVKYSKSDLNGYTRKVLDRIKKSNKTKAAIAQAIKYAIEDIVAQEFSSTPTYEFSPPVIWWQVGNQASELSANAHIILDNQDLFAPSPDEGVTTDFEGADGVNVFNGQAFALDRALPEIHRMLNEELKKKDYAYYIEVFFRSEEKQKEFFFYCLLPDEHEQLINVGSENYEPVYDYIKNKIDIDAVFDSLPIVTKENSAKAVKQKELAMPKGKKKGKEKQPEKPTEKPKEKDTAVELKKVELDIEKEKTKQQANYIEFIKEVKGLVKDKFITKKEGADMIKKFKQ